MQRHNDLIKTHAVRKATFITFIINAVNMSNMRGIDVPQPLINDLWVFLFQKIDAECIKNEPVRLEHLCLSKLL